MSVIVKGMKMPDTCLHCPFADGEYGWCDVDNSIGMCNDERPDDCPLVALPDTHGRLVDADALIEDVDGDLTDSIAEGRAIEKIMEAPTIVESEGYE